MQKSDKEFQIRRLATGDVQMFVKLVELFQQVFEMDNPVKPDDLYLQNLLDKPGFNVYAIIHQNEPVGGLTAYELVMYYSESSEMFIYDIAIKPEFQRQGLGGKLIFALKNYCQYKGIKELFVAAHEEDQHALNFYRNAGGKPEKVLHFNFRSGEER
jgi:aminoglycoside 3-N-acetyltransferase I